MSPDDTNRCEAPHRHAAEALAAAWGVDPERGLDGEQARQRLQQHGPNELRVKATRPAWQRLLQQFRSPLIYLLGLAIAISLVAWWLEGRHGWPVDAIVVAAVVVLNALLGHVQESRAEAAAAALARLTTVMASVLRDGQAQRVPSAELVPGDVLLLAEGDAVGADARLLHAATLRVQEASLTGESEPVLKDPATQDADLPLGDRRAMVFKGTAVVSGTGRAVVTATGMRTEIGGIARLLEATAEPPTPLQKEMARVGRSLAVAVVVVALVVVAAVLLLSGVRGGADLVAVLLMGVSLAVAAVPEGLPAILSLVLALGVQRMARRHAIVKNLSSVETLGAATVVCTDKTGTLTRSEMTIGRVATASGVSTVSGVGYAPEGRFEHRGSPLQGGPAHAEQLVVVSGGSLAGNAALRRSDEGDWQVMGDPTEAAFLVAEHKLGAAERRVRRFERIAQIPFSSERKMMSSIERDHEQGGLRVLVAKGAPDVLMQRCTRVRVGMAVLPFDDVRRAAAAQAVDELSDAAFRTLSVAYRPLAAHEEPHAGEALEQDLIFVGTVGIIDPPREEAAPAIREARRAGVRVVMITGDHPRTALRIAADLGIVEPGARVLSGRELDLLDDAALREAAREACVYARVAPAHKLRIVAALQADGNVVAMTGDGVNDAPALKAADIGVAMGRTGTEVSKEAAKMILADDNFATLVEAIREGRALFDNIRKCLRYLLSSNMGEVLTVFLGVLGAGWLGLQGAGTALVLPLLATQILWVNLITDTGPALALGVDPPADDPMARPPRRADAGALDAPMWRQVIEVGVVMAGAALLTMDLHLPGGFIEGGHDLATARTAGFTVLVFAQLFNCLNVRSTTSSAFHRPFVNAWLWGTLAVSVLLQVAVVHLGVLQAAFGTAPLSAGQWGVCVAMSSLVLWHGELRKWLARRGPAPARA